MPYMHAAYAKAPPTDTAPETIQVRLTGSAYEHDSCDVITATLDTRINERDRGDEYYIVDVDGTKWTLDMQHRNGPEYAFEVVTGPSVREPDLELPPVHTPSRKDATMLLAHEYPDWLNDLAARVLALENKDK